LNFTNISYFVNGSDFVFYFETGLALILKEILQITYIKWAVKLKNIFLKNICLWLIKTKPKKKILKLF